jgi:type IV pilus assembly protein PilA
MKNVQKGFTLIELMIVVAIIAILAAIAIPQYQNYITKSQFSESQTIADGLKTPIVEYYNQTGACPTVSAGAATTGFVKGGSYMGKYVATASVADAGKTPTACDITITFKSTSGSVSAPLKNNSVIIEGAVGNGGAVTWSCASTNISSKYMPQVCTGT